MAAYLNLLAQRCMVLNMTLPRGLEEQPYYSQDSACSVLNKIAMLTQQDHVMAKLMILSERSIICSCVYG